MALSACPAAIVNAPADSVWRCLVNPEEYGWIDGTVTQVVPEGRAHPGQKVLIKKSGLQIVVTVVAVQEAAHRIRLTTRFPFGITVQNAISCGELDPEHCRLQFG